MRLDCHNCKRRIEGSAKMSKVRPGVACMIASALFGCHQSAESTSGDLVRVAMLSGPKLLVQEFLTTSTVRSQHVVQTKLLESPTGQAVVSVAWPSNIATAKPFELIKQARQRQLSVTYTAGTR